MNYQIIKLSLASSYGKRSANAYKAAIYRLALSMFLSVLLGLLLVRIISHNSLPQVLPTLWLVSLFGLISYAAMGFIGFMVVSPLESSGANLYKQSIVWPMAKKSILLLRLLPYFVIWFLLLVVMSIVSVVLAVKLSVPFLYLMSGAIVCSLSGLLICVTSRPRPILLRVAVFSLTIFISGLLIQKSFDELKVWIAGLSMTVIISQLVFLLSTEGVVRKSYKKSLLDIHKLRLDKYSSKVYRVWFALKLLRNKRALNSLIFCLGLGSLIAIVLIKRRIIASHDDVGWLMFSALLAAAFSCDVRGTLRLFKAPEISGFTGVSSFVKTEALTTMVFSLIIGLPILISIILANIAPFVTVLIFYFSVQLGAAMLGLLASTYFVPQAGDIGAQLFASLCAIGMLFGLPKVTNLSDYSLIGQSYGWAAISLLSVVAINLIEFQRRKHYGNYRQV